jgi:acetoin utilization deacetylase AcuC-like enzyme
MDLHVYTHPSGLLHEMGATHPESPARLQSVLDTLHQRGIQPIEAALATREHVAKAHDAEYVDHVFELGADIPRGEYRFLDADTSLNAASLTASLAASGATLAAIDRCMTQSNSVGFVAMRPPGHHATRNKAMGFCVFNAIAVGAVNAAQLHRLERIAIIDFDVHHGNGTEDIVRGHPNVLFLSSFQSPYYPNSGANTPRPPLSNIFNSPLPSGTESAAFREMVTRDWWPALRDYQPQLLLVSAGFDAHYQDPLAYLKLNEQDYYWLGAELASLARQHTHGRMVATLEGGYNTHALARSVSAFLDGIQSAY